MNFKNSALAPIVIIIISLITGYSALKYSHKNDSALEQVAEAVLNTQGIDIDFSLDDGADDL